MKRTLGLITALVLTSVVCIGTDTVRVALDWTPNTNHTGLLVGRDRGYYDAEGLDLRLIEPGPTVALQLVALRQAEFGISSQEYVTMARAQGIPVVSIAALYPHNTSGFASPADRGIQTASDLVGKTYAGWGSEMEEAMIRTVMQLHGQDPETVAVTNIGTIDFTTAVRLDIADFYWVFYGWQGVHAELESIAFDFLPLPDLADVLDYYTPVLITSEQLLDRDPELVSRFLRATAGGYTRAVREPESSADLLVGYAPELDRDLVVASQRWLVGVSVSDVDEWGLQEERVWTQFSTWAFETGLIDSPIDPLAAFTNEHLPGASGGAQ